MILVISAQMELRMGTETVVSQRTVPSMRRKTIGVGCSHFWLHGLALHSSTVSKHGLHMAHC